MSATRTYRSSTRARVATHVRAVPSLPEPPGGPPLGGAGADAADHVADLPPEVRTLLARSDAELVAATLASDPAERYVHAHLAALRAAAAAVAASVAGRPRRRGGPRAVWDLVAEAWPDLGEQAAWFAAGAELRAAIETGRRESVDQARADRHLAAAEDLQDAVRAALGAPDDTLGAHAADRPVGVPTGRAS